jgi:hypothetical protein
MIIIEIIDIKIINNGFVYILLDDDVLKEYTKPYTHI